MHLFTSTIIANLLSTPLTPLFTYARFINEADGSQTAFIDGNQPDRVCAPMQAHIEARGGKVLTGSPVRSINLVDEDNDSMIEAGAASAVKSLTLSDGSEVVADVYISAAPVDIFKKLLPPRWAQVPFFQQCQQLEGIPVINVHLWFDRKLRGVDGLCFSRSPLLSVYADMSRCCKEYYDADRSMLELVFAPCSPAAGGKVNWIAKSDEEIVDACMGELARLFPLDVAPDPAWPLTLSADAESARASAAGATAIGEARLRKHAVVKVPRSVYAALPGRGKFRPSQATPSPNFVLAGDWTAQKFLGSMEGAVLAGKLAAEVVADTAQGRPLARGGVKPVAAAAMAALAASHAAAARGRGSEASSSSANHEGGDTAALPVGVRGDYPIAFGGGQQGSGIPYHP